MIYHFEYDRITWVQKLQKNYTWEEDRSISLWAGGLLLINLLMVMVTQVPCILPSSLLPPVHGLAAASVSDQEDSAGFGSQGAG